MIVQIQLSPRDLSFIRSSFMNEHGGLLPDVSPDVGEQCNAFCEAGQVLDRRAIQFLINNLEKTLKEVLEKHSGQGTLEQRMRAGALLEVLSYLKVLLEGMTDFDRKVLRHLNEA